MESAIYVVATPIGNLSDITQRAIDVLAAVDVIAAEDTRHTRKLLDHLGIRAQLVAVHEHNERERAESLVAEVLGGKSIAIVSDAGTPLISDPGYHIVRCAREQGCRVVPIPGACAITTALSASGLGCASFVFEGFLPAKAKARKELLESYQSTPHTVCFYESPHRILHTLEAMLEIFPERQIVLARELTKSFETFLFGTVQEVFEKVSIDENQRRGEFVVLLSSCVPVNEGEEVLSVDQQYLAKRLSKEMPPKKAAGVVADVYKVKKRVVYDFIVSLGQS